MKRTERVDRTLDFLFKYKNDDKIVLSAAKLLRDNELTIRSLTLQCANIMYYTIAKEEVIANICANCSEKAICDEIVGRKCWCKDVTTDG